VDARDTRYACEPADGAAPGSAAGTDRACRGSDRSRALVLAETALRIDASSEPLRKAAIALQRGDGVGDAIVAVADETKRSLFAAPAPSIDVAPGLRRALAERGK
jgi:hypothetical protein